MYISFGKTPPISRGNPDQARKRTNGNYFAGREVEVYFAIIPSTRAVAM